MRLKILISAASLCLIYLCTGSTTIQPSQTNTDIKKFRISKFAQHLRDTLDGTTMGYGISIYEKGSLVEHFTHGLKRTAHDGGELAFENSDRLFLGSMAKTLTAIATVQLLKKEGIKPNTKIKNYLPGDWVQGPNIDKITFRDLLNHTSGIRSTSSPTCSGESYSQLQCVIQTGVLLDSMAVPSYQNMNFAMLRILIPKLDGFNSLPGAANDTSTVYKYIRYVDNNIFNKCGLNGRALSGPDLSENVWYYQWPYNNNTGQRFYDYSLYMGAYGWYVSVDDFATVINKLFNSDKLLDKAWRDTLTTDGLGCYTYPGKNGGYFWHNGGWGIGDSNGEGGENSCWMYFPNDVICVANVNSDIPAWFPDILAHAYDKSWR